MSRNGSAADLMGVCDRVSAAAIELRRQVESGSPDVSLLPRDVADRLQGHLFDNPNVTAAAVISRACTMYFRNYLNCETIAPEMAALLLAGRPVEPTPARGLAGAADPPKRKGPR